MGNSWIIVDEREGVGRVDTWSEYLCVCRTDDPEKFEIGICRYELLGEIPPEWFDDDGQLIAAYADGSGGLILPEFYEGWSGKVKVSGYDGEYLLGELAWDEANSQPITVQGSDMVAIANAVIDLGWVTEDKDSLIKLIIKKMIN